jgi:hypothetical protein
MAGGGEQTTTQKADPWEGVQPFLRENYAMAQQASQQTPTTPYGGPFSPAPTAAMREAAQGTIDLSGQFRGQGQEAMAEGQRILSGQYLQPSAYVNPAVEAITRPMVQAATERVLPQLGMGAAQAGAFGDTGHRFQEALVARDVGQTVADTSARLMNEAFDRERRMTALAPEMISSGMRLEAMPLDMLMQAGAQQQAMDAYPISEGLAQFRESLEAPWRSVNPYAGVLSGLGTMGGGQTTTTSPGQSGLSGAIGGAMGGASLGAALPAAVGAALGFSPILPLALLGGGLGLFK